MLIDENNITLKSLSDQTLKIEDICQLLMK